MAIVGESGSGKSVTCLSLMGLLPTSARVTGSARLEGTELFSATDRDLRRIRGRRIGLVYQDPMGALDPMRTIGSQVREPLVLHLDMRRRQANDRALGLLATVGIPSPRQHLRAYPHELSGGMQQRVVIAMAIACEPSLLLADEPTTGLDVSVQAQILELLADLTQRLHLSLIIISHDLSVVAGMADHILVMYNGSVVEAGSVIEVFNHAKHPYTQGLLASIPDFSISPRCGCASDVAGSQRAAPRAALRAPGATGRRSGGDGGRGVATSAAAVPIPLPAAVRTTARDGATPTPKTPTSRILLYWATPYGSE